MANFSIHNIAIKGISCCVPENKSNNRNLDHLFQGDAEKFINATGIEERRIALKDICASDLCIEAGNKLIEALDWKKEDIQILVFVTLTGDHIVPGTSSILQDRLGLSKTCMAFDVTLGCSGYVYGLSIITGLMNSFGIKKGLLLAGDTCSKIVSKNDKTTFPLFGDAGTATALQIEENSGELLFDVGTDGSGYESIFIPHGGSRRRADTDSVIETEIAPGVSKSKYHVHLDGINVFYFGISQAPKTVNNLIDHFGIQKDEIDYYVFHQANKMMNTKIASKLNIPIEKVPASLKKFGNTSSASIPLTVVTELRDAIKNDKGKLIFSGFGVGLSWGTMYVKIKQDTPLIFTEL
ncbi:ketoacyl-ACP synthase III [Pedobacter sp. MC2016-14]|uniref:3-oxoacyl-ACP synthase III family protein n=1 Tax=Pedobacter sp. MC2016-14 TaxID=2897327 RepID=UPI001E613A6F|nr:ketoacyl-ACP synthase III [Pedobacter sp. MC2016-14]MCD0486898.1 ketoacyl-ACP synthase III [Pedobacter sp. MC2016-14]